MNTKVSNNQTIARLRGRNPRTPLCLRLMFTDDRQGGDASKDQRRQDLSGPMTLAPTKEDLPGSRTQCRPRTRTRNQDLVPTRNRDPVPTEDQDPGPRTPCADQDRGPFVPTWTQDLLCRPGP
jgi:hypothetical protein